MKATVTDHNPFGHDRYGYVFSALESQGPGRHLDYGCYDGRIITALLDAGVISSGVGIDLNADALAQADHDRAGLDFVHITSVADELPQVAEPASIDSVSLLDVLEHVADQRALLQTLHRFLTPNGRIVVTVPQQHVFSVLDGGNFKFRFPRAHRWLYLRKHTEEEYQYRYVDNPHGLIGDIEKEKAWHQHFSANELHELLESVGFRVVDTDGAGLFHRLLVYAQRLRLPVRRLVDADMRRWSRCHLFVTAEVA